MNTRVPFVMLLFVCAGTHGCRAPEGIAASTAVETPPVSTSPPRRKGTQGANAQWLLLQREFGPGWFEKAQSMPWPDLIPFSKTFGEGEMTVLAAKIETVASKPGDPVHLRTLRVKGPWLLVSDSRILYSTLKDGELKIDGAKQAEPALQMRGARFAENHLNKPYPWARR